MKSRIPLAIASGVLLAALSVGSVPAANRVPMPGVDPGPTAAARFSLVIDGVEIAAFGELGKISSGADPIDFVDSANAKGPILTKLPGKRQPPTVVLKRGLSSGMELSAWHELVLSGDIATAAKNASLVAYDATGTPIARWSLDKAWPSKLEIGGVQTGSSELLAETVTLVADRIQRVAP
jgi:phage tail-like protein